MIRTVVTALLLMAVAATGRAGAATANLTVQLVHQSAVTRTDGTWDSTASTGTTDAQLTVSPIPNGSTAIVALLYESCYNPPSQPGCVSAGGNLDIIKVGSQTATWLGSYANARYTGDGLGITVAWVNNVQGNPTTIDMISTSGGIWYDGAIVSIFSGIPSSATVDGVNGGAFASGGPMGACCGDGILTSPSVTPTQSGDFLYGVAVSYGCGPPDAGSGWTGSNFSTNYFGKTDEWQVYNSTSPIGATFPTSCGGGTSSYAATVAVKLQ